MNKSYKNVLEFCEHIAPYLLYMMAGILSFMALILLANQGLSGVKVSFTGYIYPVLSFICGGVLFIVAILLDNRNQKEFIKRYNARLFNN